MPRRDPLLFTPGPLSTSDTVRQAMTRDLGSRDQEFLDLTREIRAELLRVAGLEAGDDFEAVLMQGSGTYAVEAAVSTACRAELLVLANGAYAQRIAALGRRLGVTTGVLAFPEDQAVDPGAVDRYLADHPDADLVAAVHCETSTGALNPIQDLGEAVRRHGRTFLVDSMSAFGGIEFDLRACNVDLLVTSANKCLQGVPGFGIVLARRALLEQCAGRARSLSLDVHDQWQYLEQTGQFRFTPPTHSMLAFRQALRELEEEGGVAARARRYRENHDRMLAGMQAMGFQPYLGTDVQAPIITSFLEPTEFPFSFEAFYEGLRRRGLVIYPGKLSDLPCFRIGNIGDLHPSHVDEFLAAAREVLAEIVREADAGPA